MRLYLLKRWNVEGGLYRYLSQMGIFNVALTTAVVQSFQLLYRGFLYLLHIRLYIGHRPFLF